MQTWNTTRRSLPAMRDYVQFIVTGHKAWLLGTFDGARFRSRWAAYLPVDVTRWRRLDDEPQHPSPPPILPDKLYWSERHMRDW